MVKTLFARQTDQRLTWESRADRVGLKAFTVMVLLVKLLCPILTRKKGIAGDRGEEA